MKKININFSNNYFNTYLDTISKIRKRRKINSDKKIIVEGFINQPEYQINNLIIARKIGDIFNFGIDGISEMVIQKEHIYLKVMVLIKFIIE